MFLFGSNGKAGIGATSTPSAMLSITGAAGNNNLLSIASSSGTNFFTLGANGRVGLGTTTPSAALSITGTAGNNNLLSIASSTGTTLFIINAAGRVGIGTSTVSASSSALLTVNGNIRVGTSTAQAGCINSFGGGQIAGTCSSDENLKTNIMDLGNLSSKFESLRVINFNWNNTARDLYDNNTEMNNIGYVAQNVETLFPELVSTNSEGYKQVNYSGMSLYAVQAVKELVLGTKEASTTLANLSSTVENNFSQASSTLVSLSSAVAANYLEASTTLSALTSVVDNNYSNVSSLITGLSNTVNANYTDASSTFNNVFTLIASSTAALQTQITDITNVIEISNAPANALTISSLGVVGIGNDATPLGDEVLRVSGRVRATGFDIDSAADLAENFEAVEAMDAGTVVAFSTTTTQWNTGSGSSTDEMYVMSTVRKAREAQEAVGVISTNPGVTLGKSVQNGVPVAFSGRVPVKVTTENGEIKRGDYLTVSLTMAGHAMKLTGEGRAIGRALSDYEEGREKVLMLVDSGAQKLDLEGKTATTTGMLTTGNIDLNANGVAINNIKSLASANGTWSIDEDGRVVATMLCLEDVCIDKTTLTNVLQISGQQGIVLGTSTLPVLSNSSTTTETSSSTETTTGGGSEETATTTPPTDEQATTTEEIPPPIEEQIPPVEEVPPPSEIPPENPPVDEIPPVPPAEETPTP